MGTGTKMEVEITGGVYNMLPNLAMAKVMDANLRIVGGFTYTPEEKAWAEKIQTSFVDPKHPDLASTAKIQDFEKEDVHGSSDVSDVSWTVPTTGLSTATFVPGSAGHSWQNVAAAGTSIGAKGMMIAAKTLALSAYDLFNTPAVLKTAEKEFAERRGTDFKYEAMLGDRKPPLDYRK